MSSDSEPMSKAFFIDDKYDEQDLDLDSIPTSGIEYLRRVQMEAKQCPDVVIAQIDPSHIEKQTVRINDGKGCLPAPAGYTPTLLWQQKQAAAFSKVRQALANYKLKQSRNEKNTFEMENLPQSFDDVGWCRFCFGNQLQSEKLKMNTLHNLTTTNMTCEDDAAAGVPPLLSVITKMSQPLLIQVLDYHINWFEATGFTPQQGRWLYALLANLEKPLTPEACSSIRTLARQCANLRASLAIDDELLVHLNLLICLVTRYFDQSDLAD